MNVRPGFDFENRWNERSAKALALAIAPSPQKSRKSRSDELIAG